MQFVLNLVALLGSVGLLWKGADWFVDAAARIARRMDISELAIGLTLVALGTSAPEFAVSIGAALSGKADISVGNVVGSNVFNLGFILGGCAAIRPIVTNPQLVYRDGIFLILVTLLLAFNISDLHVSRVEGLTMFGLLAVYVGFLLWRKTPLPASEGEAEHEDASESSTPRDLGIVAVGLVLLVGGSKLLVWGASGLAAAFGMSDWAIGVTIVAAGTSAPEFFTSLNAAIKGRYGISAGNLIGSDIYNLLGVLGVAATITPLSVVESGRMSVYILAGMVCVVVIFLRTGWRLSRPEAILLIGFNVVRWWAEMTGRTWF